MGPVMYAESSPQIEHDVQRELTKRARSFASNAAATHDASTDHNGHRWPPLVRLCVTGGCGLLSWMVVLGPAWYLLGHH